MTWAQLDSSRNSFAGNPRARWDRLTDGDLTSIGGMRHQLLGRLQELYGWTRERAEADLRDWERHQEPIGPTGPATQP